MSKLECSIVGIGIGIACPLLSFVTLWWMAAAVHLCVAPVPIGLIIAVSFAGLGIGCLLDIVYLRRWVSGFFVARVWWMAALYLYLCVMAVGLFMGVPVGTFLLGIAAGAYVGRRARHHQAQETQFVAALHRSAVFVGLVTAGAALPIGILALRSELEILRWLETVLALSPNSLEGNGGLVLVGFLCLLLFGMQYWCARMAGRLAFRFEQDPIQAHSVPVR